MNVKQILTVVAISATTAITSVWGFNKLTQKSFNGTQDVSKLPVNYAGFSGFNNATGNLDFTVAATAATPAVVHIKAKTKAKQISNNLQKQRNPFGDLFGGGDIFEEFFGPRMQMMPEQKASGSGVLISEDGYIVTNNHVVQGADEITVTLANKKNYKATLVGTDANSDLAVIKVEAIGLPFLVYGNSDETKLGQWVLAIGYPLNLDVTVTAGIISAKARNIGIISNERNGEVKSPVESFIQTDAAVNPGNSGGALINPAGEFIGVNTAIASQNGSYIGYSYAIPINIVKKVVSDIIKYGTVQRAYLGINFMPENASDEEKKSVGYKDGDGVFVSGVPEGGAASNSGIKQGDYITKINDAKVQSAAEMVEQIARFKPGDKVNITYTRDGKPTTTTVTLKNKANTTAIVKQTSAIDNIGAEFVTVDKKTAQANEILGGVVVKKITGGSMKKSRIEEGFVITAVNGTDVKTVEEFNNIIKSAKGTVYLDGIYPGYGETYRYPLSLDVE